ncbi:MAG: hypothetical protein EBU46_06045 [Nitrosomonadaceae bacterium]|nr:hypothetical protein [Nitrosomonadaceae bacterium]
MKPNQEIFDQVARHLLTQNQRAMDDISCCYRVGSLTCAVGCLISPVDYRPEMEGNSINYISLNLDEEECVLITTALANSGVDCSNEETLELLQRLQAVHDTCEPVDWSSELKELARSFNLTYSIKQ